jgi:hypothetical protein
VVRVPGSGTHVTQMPGRVRCESLLQRLSLRRQSDPRVREILRGTTHPEAHTNVGGRPGQYSSCLASDSTASMNSVTMSMTTWPADLGWFIVPTICPTK